MVDVALSPADFQFVRGLLYEQSAISLEAGKEYLVEARLSPLARREGLKSVSELVGLLRNGRAGLTEEVVDAMTTNETMFFRDIHPFDALRQEIIPAVLNANGGRGISIWSAAASTGQEPYSLAMLLREHFGMVTSPFILATDLSREALARARAARYGQLEVNRGLPVSMLVKHFDRDGLEWVLKEPIRRMVTFRQMNLARPWPCLPDIDVVLLRNVLIYFDVATKAAILAQVARVLRPGGYLILGSAETTYGLDTSYEVVQAGRAVCYRLTKRNGGSSAHH